MTETLEREPEPVMVTVPRRLVRLRDPGIRATGVLILLAALGFVMFALAWRGTARTAYVPLQVPWLISGGFTALAVLGLALGAWSIHLARRDNAEHRVAFEDFVHQAAELAEDLRTGRREIPGRSPAKKSSVKRTPAKKTRSPSRPT